MSIKSTTQEAKTEARRAYEQKKAEIRLIEYKAMDEMLHTLRAANGSMTAAQLAAACKSGISKYEVAGNLFAMKNGHSRFRHTRYHDGKDIIHMSIPRTDRNGNGEYISTTGGFKREATFAEIDKSGRIVPNTERTITIYEPKHYEIKKAK